MSQAEGLTGAAAPPLARPMSGCAKLLLFAAFGCLGCVLLAMVATGVALYLVLTPPRQVPTEALVGPQTVGVARLAPMAADPGLRGALEHLSAQIGAAQAEQQPDWVRKLQRDRQGPPLVFLTLFLPSDATFVLERPDGRDELGWALAVNFRGLVRPFKWRFGSGLPGHRTHAIGALSVCEARDGGSCKAFVGGTFVLTSDLATMRLALARLVAAREGSGGGQQLPASLPPLHEGWDAVGALTDPRHDGDALLALLAPDTPAHDLAARLLAGELASLDFGVDWETSDRLRGRVEITPLDALALEGWAADLEAWLVELSAAAARAGLRLDARVDVHRDRIQVELGLDGMEQWVVEQMQK